tara:strand:- start:281 stop:1225 length:945 start_codon:yes stop_codon:yes gene_type:complete
MTSVISEKFKLPNLYIPGAGKSGTSSLHEYLGKHPEICMSTIKEPHFWTSPNFKNYTKKDFNNYSKLFEGENNSYRGESSTGYMCFSEFKPRIKKHYKSSPKFIFILRNPIDRAYSQYWWLKGIGSENLSFRKAIQKDFDIEPEEKFRLKEANFKHYYQFGLYGKWIQKFYDDFGKENILIITTENLKNKKLATLNECFKFLKLSTLESLPEIQANNTKILRFPILYKYSKILTWKDFYIKRILKKILPLKLRLAIRNNFYETVYRITKTNKEYPRISNEDREWLKELYKDDVEYLKKISNKNFKSWQDFYTAS